MIVTLTLWIYMRLTRQALLTRLSGLEGYQIALKAQTKRRKARGRLGRKKDKSRRKQTKQAK